MTPAQQDGAEACQLAVYYDGACPICRREISHYSGLPGAERIAWVDVATAPAGVLPKGLDRAGALARFHVRAADGRLVSGAEAFGHLWLGLPGWRWLGRLVLLPPALPVAEGAYRLFLHVRPHLQWFSRVRR